MAQDQKENGKYCSFVLRVNPIHDAFILTNKTSTTRTHTSSFNQDHVLKYQHTASSQRTFMIVKTLNIYVQILFNKDIKNFTMT